jgi:hypothetical protein
MVETAILQPDFQYRRNYYWSKQESALPLHVGKTSHIGELATEKIGVLVTTRISSNINAERDEAREMLTNYKRAGEGKVGAMSSRWPHGLLFHYKK